MFSLVFFIRETNQVRLLNVGNGPQTFTLYPRNLTKTPARSSFRIARFHNFKIGSKTAACDTFLPLKLAESSLRKTASLLWVARYILRSTTTSQTLSRLVSPPCLAVANPIYPLALLLCERPCVAKTKNGPKLLHSLFKFSEENHI